MNFINEQHRIGFVLKGFQNALEALLKITPVFRPGQQRAHIQGVHHRVGQDFWHIFLSDAPSQALSDSGLADARLAHQQRVVLAPAAQYLDDALHLIFASDQRVNLAVLGHLVQVLGVLLKRRRFFVLFSRAVFGLGRGFSRLGGFRRIVFLDTVRDEIHHVQPGHPLLMQVIHGVRIFFAEDCDQHVGARHFLFAAPRRLHMHDGALDHTLKPKGRLGVNIIGASHLGRVVLDEIGQ